MVSPGAELGDVAFLSEAPTDWAALKMSMNPRRVGASIHRRLPSLLSHIFIAVAGVGQ